MLNHSHWLPEAKKTLVSYRSAQGRKGEKKKPTCQANSFKRSKLRSLRKHWRHARNNYYLRTRQAPKRQSKGQQVPSVSWHWLGNCLAKRRASGCIYKHYTHTSLGELFPGQEQHDTVNVAQGSGLPVVSLWAEKYPIQKWKLHLFSSFLYSRTCCINNTSLTGELPPNALQNKALCFDIAWNLPTSSRTLKKKPPLES